MNGLADIIRDGMKLCRRCKQEKAVSEFAAHSGRPSKLRDWCRKCESEYKRAWRAEHGGKEYYRQYNERKRAVIRDWYRRRWLLTNYGMTLADYEEMLAAQNGVCAICGKPPNVDGPRNQRVLHVDHYGEMRNGGYVRGLLCWRCNMDIEILENRGHLLVRMQRYIKEKGFHV